MVLLDWLNVLEVLALAPERVASERETASLRKRLSLSTDFNTRLNHIRFLVEDIHRKHVVANLSPNES